MSGLCCHTSCTGALALLSGSLCRRLRCPGGAPQLAPSHVQCLSVCRVLELSCNSIACLLPLAGLPALRELCLQGNCIQDIAAAGVAAGSFPCLEVLDLSFCALAPTALPFLGKLPRLRHLDISGKAAARRPAAAC